MAGHIIYVHGTIPAAAEVVWDVVTDIDHADTILRSVKECSPLTEGGYDVGTRWHERRTVFGHHGEETLEVVEQVPPRRTVVETRVGHDIVRTAYRITPQGTAADRCRLAMTTTLVDADRSPLGRLAWELFGGLSYESTRRMLQHDLEDYDAEARRRSEQAGAPRREVPSGS